MRRTSFAVNGQKTILPLRFLLGRWSTVDIISETLNLSYTVSQKVWRRIADMADSASVIKITPKRRSNTASMS